MKCLRNGNVLLQDTKSNDLIELSSTLKEVKRMKGQSGVVLQNDVFRNARHSHDELFMPWIKGPGQLSLMAIKDFSMKEVKDFFCQEGETNVIPLTCVSNAEGDRLFGTSFSSGKMRLSVWERSSYARYFNLPELFSNCNIGLNEVGIVLTTEVNLEGNVLFIGGSTTFDFKRGAAIIQAINFNNKLSYITDNLMNEAKNKFVSKIKRIDNTNKLLVSTCRSIYIYLYKNQLFNFITEIKDLLSGDENLADMLMFKTTLFVLQSNSTILHQIEFESSN